MTTEQAERIVREFWMPTGHFDDVLFHATTEMLVQFHTAILDTFSRQFNAVLNDAAANSREPTATSGIDAVRTLRDTLGEEEALEG